MTPELAQASMTGVTMAAAAPAERPSPPWTYSGTYVSRARKPMPRSPEASMEGPMAR